MNLNHLRIGDLIGRTKGIFSTHYIVYSGVVNSDILGEENQIGYGVR